MKIFIKFLLFTNFLYSEAQLDSNKNSYLVGEHIEVNFNNLNSIGSDWIGIYLINTSNEEYLYWQYTDGTQYNSYNFYESGIINFTPISLPSGNYELRLFYNNNYETIAVHPFIISDSCFEISDSNYQDIFKTMTFNTWYSAQYGYGGLERVSEIIIDLNIDIIGFQETSRSSINIIKSNLQNHQEYNQLYSTESNLNIGVISRFPIIQIYDYGLYGIGADILISENDTIKFISSHLTAYPYGPYDLYEGYTIDEVLENELSTRYLENLEIYNQIIINPDNNPNIPSIYVGDHNTPSSLDWGENNLNQNLGFSVNWPVSDFLLENDFYDSYRQIHPSVIDFPGLTWSPGYPKNTFDSWDVHDRIDMIYYKHGIEKNLYPINSYIYDCDPWPSDHRAVISEFVICDNSIIGDINFDLSINVLDIIILTTEILFSSNSYCKIVVSDFDYNNQLNILDIILLINLILN